MCIEVIEHIQQDGKMLAKINKLLKKDGILVLSTPSLNAPLYKLGLLKQFDKRVGHLRRYNPQTISQLLKNNNFKLIKLIKQEGIVRNYIFTSWIGGNFLLKIINRSKPAQHLAEFLDQISLKLWGESDLIVICKKK